MIEPGTTSNHLQGLKIVLTGDFDTHERDVATRLLTACGASVTSSVSGKTTLVIAGRDPGATKLNDAKKRGLPVLNEAQLLALLSGKTLDQVLDKPTEAPPAGEVAPAPSKAAPKRGAMAPASAPKTAPIDMDLPAPKVPFPNVPIPPRDGEHTERFPGTDKIRIQGAYKDGLKQGSWKKWDESGQLREDYSWDKGSPDGPELDWYADGTRCCEGVNRAGKRAGTWQWYYEDGRPSYSYLYDDAGRRHGPLVWDLPDGQKRARGSFHEDKHHGHWTWWHDEGHERIERDYLHGAQHGQDEAWYPGGHPAYRRTWVYGRKDGLEEIYRADPEKGSVLTYRGEWKAGFAIGDHLRVDDNGQEEVTRYTCGLPEKATAPEIGERVLKALRKASSSYAKADAFGEGVQHAERAPHLLHLFRAGKVDVAADPDLWEILAQVAMFMTGEEVLNLLRRVTKADVGHGSFLPYWPDYLDRIVMEVYSRDPGPIDAGAASLPERWKKGVSFVQARFGKEPVAPLAPEMKQLSQKHLKSWGIGERVLWPDEQGRPVEQRLFVDRSFEPLPLFSKFIALFGGEGAWRAALREEAATMLGDTRLPFSLLRPVIERATPEEMIRYLDALALDNGTQDYIETALTKWRSDDTDTLLRIALGVSDNGLRKWPTVSVALLRLAKEGRPAPADLVASLPLQTEGPHYTSSWYTDPVRDLTDEQKKIPALTMSRIPILPGVADPRMRLLREALATLPRDVLTGRLDAQIREKYGATNANAYLHLVDDPALWARAFQVTETASYGHSDNSVYGLGDLGEKGIPLLLGLAKKVKGREWKQGIAKALIVALARTITERGTFDEALDKHVGVSAIASDSDYRGYDIFHQRVIHLLPTERAEAILLEGLSGKHFSRAFRMIGSHPTPRVIHKAFTELLARESTFKSEDQKAVGLGLASLPEPRAWVKWILMSGGGGGMRDALREAIGHDGMEAVEKELAASGVEKPAEIDDVEKVRRRAEAAGGGSERIYLFRTVKEGHGQDLNRIGGAPPGVGAERWPSLDGQPMTHLFTMDLDTMPELRARVTSEDGGVPRAISVFCANPENNEAYEPGNERTAVLVSSAAHIAAAGAPPEGVDASSEARFDAVPVNVSPSVWRSRSGDLSSEIYRLSGRALGEPIWLQSPDHAGSFLCQFDNGFISMNLGDNGVMYVFADTAFWQCH